MFKLGPDKSLQAQLQFDPFLKQFGLELVEKIIEEDVVVAAWLA
jgi:hypothetical protein